MLGSKIIGTLFLYAAQLWSTIYIVNLVHCSPPSSADLSRIIGYGSDSPVGEE